MLWGFFKKLAIADRLAVLVNTVFDGGDTYGSSISIIAVLLYGLQVYCDFSGGIDIARGVAQILGINMAINFRRPYFAQSLNEYWQRWHISLSGWMRDYVFYPVILSKRVSSWSRRLRKKYGKQAAKIWPTCLATFICFFTVGIWHGAAWKYVCYGLYYGILILLSQLMEPVFNWVISRLKIKTDCLSWKMFRMLRTLVLVSIAKCFTRTEDLAKGFAMLKTIFTGMDPWKIFDYNSILKLGLSGSDFLIISFGILILLVVGILQERGIEIRKTLDSQNAMARILLFSGCVVFVLIFGAYGQGFNASSFIYAKY